MTDWESVVDDNGLNIFRLALRIVGNVADAEDAVQEAFCDAYRHQQIEEISNWSGLLRRLVVHRSIDLLRRRRTSTSIDRFDILGRQSSPEAIAVAGELASKLRTLIAALPDQQATVFCLRYFENRSNEEIAESLGISPGAVATTLHKARCKLKTELARGER